jgi:hypothetical protein
LSTGLPARRVLVGFLVWLRVQRPGSTDPRLARVRSTGHRWCARPGLRRGLTGGSRGGRRGRPTAPAGHLPACGTGLARRGRPWWKGRRTSSYDSRAHRHRARTKYTTSRAGRRRRRCSARSCLAIAASTSSAVNTFVKIPIRTRTPALLCPSTQGQRRLTLWRHGVHRVGGSLDPAGHGDDVLKDPGELLHRDLRHEDGARVQDG